MSPRQLMRLWELRHGKLSAAQQEDFLSHPEIPAIIIYSPTSVLKYLKERRRLSDLRLALETQGVIKRRGRTSSPEKQSSILRKPRPNNAGDLPVIDKDLPTPNRPAKKSPRKARGLDPSLRKIAQQYKWWE